MSILEKKRISQEAVAELERIGDLIYVIRGQKVMLDSDLAQLYGVETKILKRTVKRNYERFPEDFMFQLNNQEVKHLRCQNGTSKKRHGGSRYLPYAFTEQGVAMLSGVLTSPRAIQVNIAIMRAFVRLREMLASHKELAGKLEQLERHLRDHDGQIQAIFNVIRQLMAHPEAPRKRIGFMAKESRGAYGVKKTGRRERS